MASTKLCSLAQNQNKFAIKTTKFEDQVSTCKSTKIISAMQASEIDYLKYFTQSQKPESICKQNRDSKFEDRKQKQKAKNANLNFEGSGVLLAQPQSAVPLQSGLFQKLLSISLLRTPTSQIDSLPSRRIAREEHVPLSRLAQFTKKKKSKKKYLSLSLSFKLVEEKVTLESRKEKSVK